MQHSTTRLLTTHVGSLPRPRPLADLLIRHERGASIDVAERHTGPSDWQGPV
jgi:hypothetical protein